jgi:tetraacyldisaccharide 4'-kinase
MNINKIFKFIRIIFIPLIPVYLFIYYIKRFISKSEKFNIPVICVGNITTGGTGKTPAVIELAKLLLIMGLNPGIVSRGYHGSKSKEGAIVTDGNAIFLIPEECGDEPFLIAKSLMQVPVAICANRFKAIQNLLGRFKIDLILMDDGFQNNSIYKDINIVIIDAANPFGNGLILPAGDLRESIQSLKRSDIIIINKSDLVTEDQLSILTTKIERKANNKRIFYSRYGNGIFYRINNLKNTLPPENILNKKILLISGIGNPEAFTRTINRYKPALIKHIPYPDHHYYSLHEIEKIVDKSKQFDLIITTEKDYIKMKDFQLPDNFYYLKVSFVINNIDIFSKYIDSYLKGGIYVR